MRLDPLVYRDAAEALANGTASDFAMAVQHGLWRRGITDGKERPYRLAFIMFYPQWLYLFKDNEHAHDCLVLMACIVENP